MSILVTGGAGYIGSHTVYALAEAGRNVIATDIAVSHPKAVHPKAKYYSADIHDSTALENIFQNEEIEGVIHFAAKSQVGESMQDPLIYYRHNVAGSINLLKSMVNHGVDKLVFSSTASVYGEPKHIPIRESDPTEPTNCYGETKLAVERMMEWTSRAHGLRYVALRYFNACGAHESGNIGESHDPESHLIPVILQVPNGQRERASIFGNDYPTRDGTCVRDYIHVSDLASAHILALDYLFKGGDNNVFNLGNGIGFTVQEVLDCARKVTGHPIPAEISPRRPGDPAQLVATSAKATAVLGWQPKYESLEAIVQTAWNWHKHHPHGYKD